MGKAYHIKICDFGSDNVEYCADYSQQDDGLLIPLRWMAWESVLQVYFIYLYKPVCVIVTVSQYFFLVNI